MGHWASKKIVARDFYISSKPMGTDPKSRTFDLSDPIANQASDEAIYVAVAGRPAGLWNFIREHVGLSRRLEFVMSASQRIQRLGSTGRADRAIRSGLEKAGDPERDATRRTSFITLIAIGAFTVSSATGYLEAAGVDLKGFAPSPEQEPSHPFYQASRGPNGGFSFEGEFGSWDIDQLRRGYVVYKEVCSACHSLQVMAFQDLEGLGMSKADMKAEAATWSVIGVDPTTGESIVRSAAPNDYFPMPFANPIAAAYANDKAVPPDLSMIIKARRGSSNYVYSLLTGYGAPEPSGAAQARFEIPNGRYFNRYSAKGNIAMPPPLAADGQVSYADGTIATVPQMAADVAAFLTWTAETLPAERN